MPEAMCMVNWHLLVKGTMSLSLASIYHLSLILGLFPQPVVPKSVMRTLLIP